MSWKDRRRPPRAYLESKPRIRVLYQGPWQAAIRVEREALDSSFVQIIRVSQGDPVIHIEERINWRTRNSALKVAIQPRLRAGKASYDMGLAVTDRLDNHAELFEMPQHAFVSMSDGKQGLSIVNACCYGADKPSEGMLRMTLLYTPHSGAEALRYQATQDFGRHRLHWGFMPHEGDWRSAQTREWSEGLNEPLLVYHPDGERDSLKRGVLGKRYAFMNAEGVAIKAIKQEENLGDNARVLVRVYERLGQGPKPFKLSLPSAVSEVTEVNGQEQAIGEPKPLSGQSFEGKITSFGMKSYIFKLRPLAASRKAVSTAVPLPFDIKVFSDDSRSLQSTIAKSSLSFPVEEYPASLRSRGVEFNLEASRKSGPDAVSAAGQVIKLPKRAKGAIHLLVFSTRDHRAKVKVDDRVIELSVPKFHGRIADGDRRNLDEDHELESLRPAFHRRAPIADFARHTHGKLGNLSHYPSYLFHCVLPAGKTLEILPDPDFFVVAASVSTAYPLVTALDELESTCEASK